MVSELELKELRSRLNQAVQRICPPWLVAHSDDLVQTGIIKVSEIIKKSEGTQSFSASYFWKVAYSALVDEIRRQRRRRETSMTDEEGAELDMLSDAPNPELHLHGRQIGEGIRHCLSRLVTARRLAVALHLQGHNVPSAAKTLGWSVKKVENLVYRGLNDLRKCLETKGLMP